MDFFSILRQLAAQDPIVASLAANAVYNAVAWLVRGIAEPLPAAPEENLFDVLFRRAVEAAGADWSPLLLERVAAIRGAFADGRVPDRDTFAALLEDAGVHPDAADRLLEQLRDQLRTAVLEAARHEPRAFRPAVLNELVDLGVLLRTDITSLLVAIDERTRRMEQMLQDIHDGLPHRPDEMRPPEVAPSYEFTEQESSLLADVQDALSEAPALIDAGSLQDAQDRLLIARTDVGVLLDRLRAAGAPADQRRPLLMLLARADIQLGTAAFAAYQYLVAAEVYQRAVDHARDSQDADTLFLAVYQTGVAYGYARLFRRAEPRFREAVALRPDDLSARGNLAVVIDELGAKREALALHQQLLPQYRALAEREPAAFTPAVAMTLNNLGTVLRALGDRAGAQAAFDEALTLRRALAEREPAAFTPDVAGTLNNLGTVLSDLGDRAGAQAAYEEALDLYRALAEREPAAFTPDVAMTLNNLGNVLSDLGDRAGAQAAFEEALTLRRALAEREPAAFTQYVATTLNNLGNVLSDLGDRAGAQAAYEEALDLYRALAAREPAAFTPAVAMTLNNLGNVLSDLGDRAGAQAAYDEAIALYTPLAEQYPAAFGPDLDRVLRNRARLDSP